MLFSFLLTWTSGLSLLSPAAYNCLQTSEGLGLLVFRVHA